MRSRIDPEHPVTPPKTRKKLAMRHHAIEVVEKPQLKDTMPRLSVGDTTDVHVRILEGSKERVQVFSGVIIKVQGSGLNQSITVRRIVANEGVERIFKIHSPKIAKIEIKRHGHVRRSRIYYLRERIGKKRRLRDRRRGLGQFANSKTRKAVETVS